MLIIILNQFSESADAYNEDIRVADQTIRLINLIH